MQTKNSYLFYPLNTDNKLFDRVLTSALDYSDRSFRTPKHGVVLQLSSRPKSVQLDSGKSVKSFWNEAEKTSTEIKSKLSRRRNTLPDFYPAEFSSRESLNNPILIVTSRPQKVKFKFPPEVQTCIPTPNRLFLPKSKAKLEWKRAQKLSSFTDPEVHQLVNHFRPKIIASAETENTRSSRKTARSVSYLFIDGSFI